MDHQSVPTPSSPVLPSAGQIAGLPVATPRFFASSFNAIATHGEFLIVCGQLLPTLNGAGGFADPVSQPVVTLSMSPVAAKELMLLLKGVLGQFEDASGTLTSPFIAERTAQVG